MGYRSDVQLAVYAKTKEDFITAFTHWRLDNGVDFTEWTMWDQTETIDWPRSIHGLSIFGFIFTNEQVKWYAGYSDVDEVERTIQQLSSYGFCVEFIRIGEETGDVETYEYAPDNMDIFGLFYTVTLVERSVNASDVSKHTLGDKSWIASYVENTSTIGDQRSDTQPA